MTEAQPANIGVIGMAVMGSNLARNLARNGHRVAVYNRTTAKTDAVIAEQKTRRRLGNEISGRATASLNSDA